MKQFWLSFCDPNRPRGEQFLGVTIVRAHDLISAAKVAYALNANPGGEVEVIEIPTENKFPPSLEGRLMREICTGCCRVMEPQLMTRCAESCSTCDRIVCDGCIDMHNECEVNGHVPWTISRSESMTCKSCETRVRFDGLDEWPEGWAADWEQRTRSAMCALRGVIQR